MAHVETRLTTLRMTEEEQWADYERAVLKAGKVVEAGETPSARREAARAALRKTWLLIHINQP